MQCNTVGEMSAVKPSVLIWDDNSQDIMRGKKHHVQRKHTHTHNLLMHRIFLIGYTNKTSNWCERKYISLIVCPFYIA